MLTQTGSVQELYWFDRERTKLRCPLTGMTSGLGSGDMRAPRTVMPPPGSDGPQSFPCLHKVCLFDGHTSVEGESEPLKSGLDRLPGVAGHQCSEREGGTQVELGIWDADASCAEPVTELSA